MCRLPYDFYFENQKLKSGYLLSAKDFNMLNRLKDLEEGGVDSLKIEGRARRPYYVGEITKTYRQALNKLPINEEDVKLAFNRGFTEGYFNGNGDIISNKQNHVGVEVGKVEKFKSGKKFNEIFISSNREISPKSVLKFIGENETVVTAYDIQKVKELYRITTTQKVNEGEIVNLISDYEKEQLMLNNKTRKKVNVKIIAKVGKQIEAKINLFNEQIVVLGELCLPAKNQPLSEVELKTNFNKSDFFEVELCCELENVFLPKKDLNEFRRKVIEEIFKIHTLNKRKKLNKILLNSLKNGKKINKLSDFIEIFDNFEKFFKENKIIKEKNIIYSPEVYELNNVQNFINICKLNNKKPILDLLNFATQKDIEMLKEIVEKTKVSVVVNNLYALNFNTEKIIGGGLNVYNSYTANYFNLPYIAAEGDEYKMPYITMRHCPMKQHVNGNCTNCPYKNGYYYKMQNGNILKLKRKKLTECTFYLTIKKRTS